MEITLDEYLEMVDVWKEAASNRRAATGNGKSEQSSVEWLEARLGRSLVRVPPPIAPGRPAYVGNDKNG